MIALQDIPRLVAMGILLCLSGFFSSSEPAILSLNRLELRAFRASKKLGKKLAVNLFQHPSELLSTVLLWNNVVNILYFTTGTIFCLRLQQRGIDPAVNSLFALGFLVVLVIFGETLPKLFAIHHAVRLAPLSSVALYVLGKLTAPLRPLFEAVVRHTVGVFRWLPVSQHLSTDELQLLLQLGEEQGSLSSSERSVIEEIIELGELQVREIMEPRVDMLAASVDAPVEELQRLVLSHHREKIPIYEGNLDNIVGIVHAKDLFLDEPRTLKDCLKPSLFVPETAKVESLLELLRSKRATMSVVVDEYGGVAGTVSLEDALSEIVGEIEEEPAQPLVEQIDRGRFILMGNLSIRKWSELFRVELGEYKPETVAGLIAALLGRLPREGDTVHYSNLTLTVLKVERHRVKQILLEVRDGS